MDLDLDLAINLNFKVLIFSQFLPDKFLAHILEKSNPHLQEKKNTFMIALNTLLRVLENLGKVHSYHR